jgi:hypothetical protein
MSRRETGEDAATHRGREPGLHEVRREALHSGTGGFAAMVPSSAISKRGGIHAASGNRSVLIQIRRPCLPH